ncbi:uncharacterized protein J7T54_004121 [Emericellopsis cladophorae]|uniref:Uncharacterized protein n=1 Tax=Emericellopsis cladophorae TaxID=2686198 RepID=A0A9P9XUU9_9HYPO|nr:uncharacterized protein J7T54_004121 [Emericellopsis cladophorae]KAI6778226.1 hypothetical protein J7T54_004121 [Emericellopsis cladophorae]
MPRFAFPIPGRSKKQAQPPPNEPMSKAHRVLGSPQLSLDSKSQPWDARSYSGPSASPSEATASPTYGSARGQPRQHNRERDWSNESDILPHNSPAEGYEDAYSDYTGNLRNQPSSSTIRSWYDRTKQPLAVSQQTSASAMAKGLPSKAQRLLDMDNNHGNLATNSRQKPADLDLSLAIPGGRGKTQRFQPSGGPAGAYVARSPSVLSPLTPEWTKTRRRIQKRHTSEDLRQDHGSHRQPGTNDGQMPGPERLDELPSLYKHYEQMSFAQIMDGTQEPVKTAARPMRHALSSPDRLDDVDEQAASAVFHHQLTYSRDDVSRAPRDSHGTTTNTHSTHSSLCTQRTHPTQLGYPSQWNHPVQIVHAPTPTKAEHSPIDCGESVSSRHTRTSKASRRTEKSIRDADLQEKSVLMLSSDSEEDEDDRDSAQSPRKLASSSSVHTAPSLTGSGQTGTDDLEADDALYPGGLQPEPTRKRVSRAPAGFLTIPSQPLNKSPSPPMSTPSTGDPRMSWAEPLSLANSNSTASLSTTASSGGTAMVQEARAVTLVPAQGPEPASDEESDLEYDRPQHVMRDSILPSKTFEPQPLSPSSMEFYIQSPRSGDSDEHFMGLTRQEQMLIQALRHRRETRRQLHEAGGATQDNSRAHWRQSSKGHRSNTSEATITESTLNFDFPAPPSHKDNGLAGIMNRIQQDPMEDQPSNSRTTDGKGFALSPPPPSSRRSATSPASNTTPGLEPTAKLDVGAILEARTYKSEEYLKARACTGQNPQSPRDKFRRQRLPADRRRAAKEQLDTPTTSTDRRPAVADGKPSSSQRVQPDQGTDMPRPDSPISPDAFPSVPGRRRTLNSQSVRLSAFGPPAPANGEMGWWGDED